MRSPKCADGVHVAINSLEAYREPRARLLDGLAAAGVPMHQVHVFLGGAAGAAASAGREDDQQLAAASSDAHGARFYRVPHNSVDFTAMVHIVEHPHLFRHIRQWFYMHDTCAVGAGFWGNISRWCAELPACALPLTRYQPSSSMGLYDAAFLAAHAADVVALKNSHGVRLFSALIH